MYARRYKKNLKVCTIALVFSLLWLPSQAGGDTVRRAADCYIVTGYGVGYSVFCDQGTSPLVYRGPAAAASLGFEADWPLWRMSVEVDFVGGTYINRFQKKLNFNNIGGVLSLNAGVMRRVSQNGRWSFWGGVELADFAGLRHNPSLNNSSTTFDNFALLNLCGRVEYTIGRWRFHAEADVSPLAFSFRPGYAFIDNHSATNEADKLLLDNYKWQTGAFDFFSTDIGVSLELKGGNLLGLSYIWGMLTTGASSDNRLVEAAHLLVISFNFKLN